WDAATVASSSDPLPNNFALEVRLPKDLVHERADKVVHVRPDVDEDASAGPKKVMEEERGFIEPLEVALQTTTPCVSVRLLLQDARLLDEFCRSIIIVVGRVGNGRREGKVSPR